MQPEAPAVRVQITRQQYQRTARDVAIAQAMLAACQEYTKGWFCRPVAIRIDIDAVIASVK